MITFIIVFFIGLLIGLIAGWYVTARTLGEAERKSSVERIKRIPHV